MKTMETTKTAEKIGIYSNDLNEILVGIIQGLTYDDFVGEAIAYILTKMQGGLTFKDQTHLKSTILLKAKSIEKDALKNHNVSKRSGDLFTVNDDGVKEELCPCTPDEDSRLLHCLKKTVKKALKLLNEEQKELFGLYFEQSKTLKQIESLKRYGKKSTVATKINRIVETIQAYHEAHGIDTELYINSITKPGKVKTGQTYDTSPSYPSMRYLFENPGVPQDTSWLKNINPVYWVKKDYYVNVAGL